MSNLTNFIVSDEKEKIVIIDGHNLIFRTIFIAEKHNTQFGTEDDESFSYWKFIFVKSLMGVISNFEPTKLILVMDSKNTWRKEYYPEYKAQRKTAREGSKIDFNKFFPIMDAFYEDLKKTIPNIMHLKVDRCEGDDLIAVAIKYFKDDNVEIISTDRDLNQCLVEKRVKQYDPIKRVYINPLNPAVDLEVKIITGDKGDNIPAIKPKCGPVTAAKIIKEELLESLCEDPEIKNNFERNKLLIDLNMIPKDIVQTINETINSYALSKFAGSKMFNFAIKHRLASMLDNMQEINGVFNRLNEFI